MNILFKKTTVLFCISALFIVVGCKKEDYFKNDAGVSKAKYNGSIYDYLHNNHLYFDTLSAIISYAGMQEQFENDSFTFFAPPDSTISRSIMALNRQLSFSGQKEITSFKQISPSSWKAFLSMYIFKGEKRLADFPQIDISNLMAFPGQYYRSLDSTLMNIGVVYSDLLIV